MLHAPLFLAVLVLSEVLLVPATLLLPFSSALVAIRAIRFAVRINRTLRRVLLTQRLLRLMLNRRNKLISLARGSCLRKFLCEMRERNSRWRKRVWSDVLQTSLGLEPRLVITVNISDSSQHSSSCSRQFESCPHTYQGMLQTFKKLNAVWRNIRVPGIANFLKEIVSE